MRHGLVAQWAGIGAWTVALALAGCSSSSPGLPAAVDVRSFGLVNAGDPTLRLLESQASGVLPGSISREVIQREVKDAQNHPRPRPFRHSGTVGLWASYQSYDELLGYSESARTLVDVVDLYANNCFGPNAVKVDHNRNIWVACEETKISIPSGGEQEYSSDGALEQSYSFDLVSACHALCTGLSFDGGWDTHGHVFSELSVGVLNGKHRERGTDPGFFWWDAKHSSGPGTFIRASRYCRPMCGIDYMDTDKAGNIWFDFAADSAGYKGGLAEVVSPTISPSIRVIFPAGTYGHPGGVYVSGHSTVLNVTDQETQETYQYRLPVTASSKPFNVLGPSGGAPVQGGFNKVETAMVLGGEYAGVQTGKLPANMWKTMYCGVKGDMGACPGAAYTPSDK